MTTVGVCAVYLACICYMYIYLLIDHLPEAIRVEIADSLSLLSTEELVDIAADLGFSEAEVVDRLKYLSQKSLILELLSEYSKRTPHHVRRRLEQLLLNKGHLTEALKIYPMGMSVVN